MNVDVKTLKVAFKDSLPVLCGYLVLGIGYGIMMSDAGYNWIWTFISSLLIFSGSMQYLQVDLLNSGASIISSALLTLMVNMRYMFYSITLVEKYRHQKAKLYCEFAAPDETYSLIMNYKQQEGVDEHNYNLYLSLLDHSYWIMATVIGNILGNVLPFDTTGVDFSMTALFIVLFIENWKDSKNHLSAIIGIITSLIWLFIAGASNFLIPTMVSMVIIFAIIRHVKGEDYVD